MRGHGVAAQADAAHGPHRPSRELKAQRSQGERRARSSDRARGAGNGPARTNIFGAIVAAAAWATPGEICGALQARARSASTDVVEIRVSFPFPDSHSVRRRREPSPRDPPPQGRRDGSATCRARPCITEIENDLPPRGRCTTRCGASGSAHVVGINRTAGPRAVHASMPRTSLPARTACRSGRWVPPAR